jgi:putative ATP-binding cassette transporter
MSAKPVAHRHTRLGFVRQVIRLAGAYWTGADAPASPTPPDQSASADPSRTISRSGSRSGGRRRKTRLLTGALLVLTLAQVALVVWTNYWNRALFDALEQRSLSGFLIQIGTFAFIFLLTIGVTAAHLQVKRWLQLDWRRWLTERLMARWMTRGHHYQLLFTAGEHDNPDGRVAEDIRIATETAINLAHSLVYSLLILGSFIQILLSVSGSAPVPGTSVMVPGYMVIAAFAYAACGAVLGLMLGRPLIASTNRLQTAEASFRFGLAHARENSESIALMHGEPVERQQATTLFAAVRSSWNRQTLAYAWVVSFSGGYGTLLPVFPILIAAPQFIAGAMTLGVLMQAAQAFQKLTSALSWPIENLGEMAQCRASADRVLSLYDDLLQLDADNQSTAGHIAFREADGAALDIRDLCITHPSGQILLENFNATIERGERVLIAGDATVTMALFKVIAGLWPWGSGTVLLPQAQVISFVPQRPFLPQGTLDALLCYPQPAHSYEMTAVQHALDCVGVGWLLPRLGDSDNWERALTLRTQQRLAFARLLLQRPEWIFIAEATDALDADAERSLMEMLRHELPDATIITISFHSGLESLHHRKLVLNRLREPRFLRDQPMSGHESTGEALPTAQPTGATDIDTATASDRVRA